MREILVWTHSISTSCSDASKFVATQGDMGEGACGRRGGGGGVVLMNPVHGRMQWDHPGQQLLMLSICICSGGSKDQRQGKKGVEEEAASRTLKKRKAQTHQWNAIA